MKDNYFYYYFGSFRRIVARMGIETTFVDFTDVEKLKNAIKDNTKVSVVISTSTMIMQVPLGS